MKYFLALWALLLSMNAAVHAQEAAPPSLNVGDPAPSLPPGTWLKGKPVAGFAKGTVYVLEFWATWCVPCVAAMPHLSALARKYGDKVVIIGVDIYENETTPLKKIKVFVDSMGARMDYAAVTDTNNLMANNWMDAAGERKNGIPRSFVVNGEGKLAWIGHPKNLAGVLQQVVDKSWDTGKERAQRNFNRYLEELEDSVKYKLFKYRDNPDEPLDIRKADSMLAKIGEIVQNEPRLKYAPIIASFTFSSLLKKDPQKACEFGKIVMVTPTYEEPAYGMIIHAIEANAERINLPAEVYALGAEARRIQIEAFPYPETMDMHKFYHKMAEWYWRAGDKPCAIEAGQKAIEAMKGKKGKKGLTPADIAALEARLQQYQAM